MATILCVIDSMAQSPAVHTDYRVEYVDAVTSFALLMWYCQTETNTLYLSGAYITDAKMLLAKNF